MYNPIHCMFKRRFTFFYFFKKDNSDDDFGGRVTREVVRKYNANLFSLNFLSIVNLEQTPNFRFLKHII